MENIDITQLLTAIQGHQWTIVAGIATLVVLRVWKSVKPDVWASIPAWAQTVLPFVVIGGTGFAEKLLSGGAWLEGVLVGLVVALLEVGAHHTAKKKRFVSPAKPAAAEPPTEEHAQAEPAVEVTGVLTRVDDDSGVVALRVSNESAKRLGSAGQSARLTLLAAAMLLAGCSQFGGAPVQTVQDVADTAVDLCNNTLLRSDTPRMLVDSGVLPDVVSSVINSACKVLAASKPGIDTLLEQAKLQRTTPARMLTTEAHRRGLL